ncbi:MAG: hypothetical protein EX268_18970 [Deltaproteobacteria bacterium]|nr:MAG: hypothetical protein EX268_18970 [Deltaproteobacteria bacterium]
MIRGSRLIWLRAALACAMAFTLGCERDPTAVKAAAPSTQATDAAPSGPKPRIVQFGTETLPIDRIYHSMQGPFDRVYLDASELDWVTAARTDVVEQASQKRMGDEFFCHSQLQLPNGTRLLTMATGADDLRFPKGFAMPVSAIVEGQPEPLRGLTFLGMVLNNHEAEINKQTKVVTTLEYFKDSDFGNKPRPKKLYMTSLLMEVENLEEYKPGKDEPPISDDVTTHCALVEQPLGGKLKLHWMVPPGLQKTRKLDRNLIPIDGTVHFAWAHLHNYGVYMRLTDVTTGKVLFQADVENEPDRDQIANISQYSSEKGFRLYKDHVYEIEALYNNTTDHDVDAMAMMVLYYNPDGDLNIKYTGRQ